jgi:hypothetical protein
MRARAARGRAPRPAPRGAGRGGTAPPAGCAAAARLRAAGWRGRLAAGRIGAPLVREADRAGAAEALVADARGLARVDRAGERAEPLGDPLPAPPRRSWAAAGGEPV